MMAGMPRMQARRPTAWWSDAGRRARWWPRVQGLLADVPGARGEQLRRRAYAPFFLGFGEDVSIAPHCRFVHPDRIVLDDGARIASGAVLDGTEGLRIDRRARVRPHVTVAATDGPVHVRELAVVGADGPSPDEAAAWAPAAPTVALLAGTELSRLTATHLLSCVGTPQAVVVGSNEAFPPTARVALLLDEHIDLPTTFNRAGQWRVCAPEVTVHGSARVDAIGSEPLGHLPASHLVSTSPAPSPARDPLWNVATQTLHYARKRMQRAAQEAPLTRVGARVLEDVLVGHRYEEAAKRVRLGPWRTLDGQSATRWAVSVGLRGLGDDALLPPEGGLVTLSAASPRRGRVALRWLMRQRAHRDITASLRAEMAFVAVRLGKPSWTEELLDELLGPAWLDDTAACIRERPGQAAFSYAPLLAALLIDRLTTAADGALPALDTHELEPAVWGALDGEGTTGDVLVEGREQSGLLFQQHGQRLCRAFFDAWRSAHAAPELVDARFELHDAHYDNTAAVLETTWRRWMRVALEAVGEPFLEVHPWPAPYQAALSLRLDVDRRETPGQVEHYLSVQRNVTGHGASWYFRDDRDPQDDVQQLLERHHQERGTHRVLGTASFPPGGVTAHSAPGSHYWRGATTVDLDEAQAADYGELLSAQCLTPRPCWRPGPDGGRPSRVWMTPTHLPMEGSTSDRTLAYFDRLRHRFSEQLQAGGHIILGLHPDIDHDLVTALFARQSLPRLWAASVGDVVDRTRRTLAYDALRVVTLSDGDWALGARRAVADLRVSIWWPGDNQARTLSLQLEPGQPVRLPMARIPQGKPAEPATSR